MLLQVASLLTAFGFAAFIVGHIFEYYGLAFIGAVLIIVTGAWIMTTGLQAEAGTIETNVSANETVTETRYDTVQSPFPNFSVGFGVFIVGSVAGLQALRSFQDP